MVKVKKSEVLKEEEVKVEEVSKKEEKTKVLPSKEKICEFYWITDGEILNPKTDYSKYGISAQEESILREWWVEHMKHTVKDVTFDIYEKDNEVRAVLNKYGVTPADVANNKLDELSESEKEIITNYYYKRAWVENTHI